MATTNWNYQNYGNLGKFGPYRGRYQNQMFTDPMRTGFRPDITSDFDPTATMGVPRSGLNTPAYMGAPTDPGATSSTTPKPGGISPAGKFGIAAGASTLGGVINLAQLYKQAQDFEQAGIQDLVPQATKDALGEATLRASSTRDSNYGQQLDNIRTAQNQVTGSAQLTASSPDQIQKAALDAQKNANRAILQLGESGVQNQRQSRAVKRGLQGEVGNYQALAKRNYDQGLASFYNAKQAQVGNMINGVASSALLAL